MPNTKRNLLTGITAIAVAVGVVGGAYWYMSGGTPPKDVDDPTEQPMADMAKPDDAVASGDIKIGTDPYTLTDINGKQITEKSFPDKFKLVFFGFTNCTDICPIALQTMTTALKNLGADAAKVQPIFITVDPKHDTTAKLKEYLKNFSPQIIGATGTAEQLKTAEGSFRVYASDGKAEVEDGDEDAHASDHAAHDNEHHHMAMEGDDADAVNHSDNIYLLKPSNGFVNVFNGDVDADKLTQEIKTAIAQTK